jgi:glucuronosyltransferase
MATYYEEFASLMEWGAVACEKLLASQHIDVLLDLSRDRKFDVLITEFFNTDCTLGLAYKLNITSYIGMVCKMFCKFFVQVFL